MPTHEKLFAVGKSGPSATFLPIFSWVWLALGWGVRRFHNNIYQVHVFQPNIIWYIANTLLNNSRFSRQRRERREIFSITGRRAILIFSTTERVRVQHSKQCKQTRRATRLSMEKEISTRSPEEVAIFFLCAL